ncbi:MAG: polysaccharide biosynthesis tyrosine autokinase [Chloroflexaceae bacterium]|nr:polysaccharide biosynthesis tyrosine autokinase [Chloroflexaceae bacterium]
MELLAYWKIIRKRLWLIIFLMISSGIGTVLYTSQQVPLYHTTTTLFINPGQVSPLLPTAAVELGNNRVESLANTYIELIATRSFIQRVADEMDQDIAEADIQRALQSQYVDGTQFFRISATHPDPQVAQDIANTAAQVLIASEVSRQQSQQQQIEEQRQLSDAPEKNRLQELIAALELEITTYDQRISELEDQKDDLERQNRNDQQREELEALNTLLIEQRYARIDLQTRLANAQARLAEVTTPVSQPPGVDTAVVVDTALLPATPLPFDTFQRTMLAVMIGMFIGVALAFLLEYIDYTVKSPEALDAVYGIATRGVIGVVSPSERKKPGGYLVTLNDSLSPIAESFRALRTSIQVANMSTPVRSLLVTSAGPNEGKTFVATNLAASFALAGSRVILVDADLRKPSLQHIFDIARTPGFTNLVISQQNDQPLDLDAFLQTTAIPNLRVLTSGTIPPNPAELINSERAQRVMQQLEATADIIIYDSPPAATVTDASLIARRVSAVIQVVWAGQTRIHLVQRCKMILEQVGANILGPVLNQVNLPDLGYYAYYYSYGYYHQSSQKKKPTGLFRWFRWSKRSRRSQHYEVMRPINSTNGHGTSVETEALIQSQNGNTRQP